MNTENTPPVTPAPPVPPMPPVTPVTPYVQTTPKIDGLAVASLVLGILWLYWVGSVLAVIFGGVALKRINDSHGWRTGKGMAIAGLVLGLVGMGTLALVLMIAASASS